MWCRDCHKEVDVKAAGASGAACPLCGRAMVASSRQTDDIRRAYEILERWQSSDLFERISTTAPLTTLKQQDRAPLLNIPLNKQKPTAQVATSPAIATSAAAAPAAAAVQERPAISLQPPVPRSCTAPRVTLDRRLPTPPASTLSAPDQVLWDLLVAPRPLLATAAPAQDEQDRPASVVPEALVAGVTEKLPPQVEPVRANQPVREHEPVQKIEPVRNPEPAHRSEPVQMSHAMVDEIMADAARPSAADPFGTADFVRPETSAEDLFASAEVLQTALPVPKLSASIYVEPADYESNSADSANDIKQAQTNTTKNNEKSKRPALRRPPLNRRFQLERSVSESSAGSDTVTRKLRLDQTGADAETLQAKDPVTSLPSSVAPETKIVSNSPKPGRRVRVDNAEPMDVVTGTDGRRARTQGLPKRRYIDEAHESQIRGPHFEVSAPRRSNLTSMTGQFLAYLGVLGLTVGTAMVIYGHFGGYSEYTPTGWLVTTVAQMLLFLGVINLVSGGIEQNNEDVSRRINTLGEQLLRIEQVTSDAVRGPKLPAHLYADDAAESHESSSRETVTVHRQ